MLFLYNLCSITCEIYLFDELPHCVKNTTLLLQLSGVTTTWVLGHVELLIGKMDTRLRKEALLAPTNKNINQYSHYNNRKETNA